MTQEEAEALSKLQRRLTSALAGALTDIKEAYQITTMLDEMSKDDPELHLDLGTVQPLITHAREISDYSNSIARRQAGLLTAWISQARPSMPDAHLVQAAQTLDTVHGVAV